MASAIRAENESAIECCPDARITYSRIFNIKGQMSNQPRSTVLLSETELLLRNPLTLNRTLHFNSAFIYVGLNPSPRLNTHFPLIQWPT